MRPQILYPLFAAATTLPGIGPRLGKLVEKLAGPRIVDLLWHLPVGVIDRRYAPKVRDAAEGRIATLTVWVDGHQPPGNPRLPYRVRCRDETGFLFLVFFHARPDYLHKLLPPGAQVVVSGRVERFRDQLQITHPDHVGSIGELESLKGVEPVYPLTTGLTLKVLGRAIRAALKRAPELPEWIDGAHLARTGWPSWRAALNAAHAPESEADLDPATTARTRLAYDELLANQLAVSLVRAHQRRLAGRPVSGDGRLRRKAVAALPFTLTRSQDAAVREILGDMAGEARMLRLLQGDVGSGKTVVACLAMLNAVEAGAQAALMAPTEILARQHFGTIAPLAQAAGVRLALLTGRDKGKPRELVLEGLRDGSIEMVVGTHALFQEDVAFKDLALAVVDEQHRFGVHQRLLLAAKGRAIDMLVMTATPIPRTLMLAAYGDMDVSRLTEKPAGRRPIDTRAIPLERIEEVVAAVRRAMDAGAKVYWICPLVEESEAIDLAAASERYAHLAACFPGKVGLVHGRLRSSEKDAVMAAFARGPLTLLVATTVIEVGVDVPDATVMVIEHAERFGLAQLHQLRGRIGRSDKPSTCLLLYATPLGETARTRLAIMRETDDGFRIAEEDFRLRGPGELLGTRQSGLPAFRLADLTVHQEQLATARDDARLALDRDPDLASPRGQALRTLLYLFERDAAVKYLRSG
ncbi:MAG TPA: ATP-dependent DNA helicase RecG [Alphaproteobacteria bacterium]|nr:ATP-dependent DNA helicase RecG [Alphaproteobacteria bacterium]